jgi:hypothetical protein
MGGFGTPHTYLLSFRSKLEFAPWGAVVGTSKSLTLKTTDTTRVSVDGNIGHRGALVPLPHASPETITEETPSATVTLTQSHGRGKARPRS